MGSDTCAGRESSSCGGLLTVGKWWLDLWCFFSPCRDAKIVGIAEGRRRTNGHSFSLKRCQIWSVRNPNHQQETDLPAYLTVGESWNILSFLLFSFLSLSSVQFFKIASSRTPITSLRERFHGSVLHWKGKRGTGEMEYSSIPLRAATDISACVIYDTASQNRCFENTFFLQAWNSATRLSRTAAEGKEFLGFSGYINIKWVLM